jgi:hypothetical protein
MCYVAALPLSSSSQAMPVSFQNNNEKETQTVKKDYLCFSVQCDFHVFQSASNNFIIYFHLFQLGRFEKELCKVFMLQLNERRYYVQCIYLEVWNCSRTGDLCLALK